MENRNIYLLSHTVPMVMAFIFIDRIYAHGVFVAIAVGLLISWVSMQLIARIYEDRWLWPPKSQYRGFFWGNLIFLPGIAGTIAYALTRVPDGDYFYHELWWQIVCIVAGLVTGAIFRITDSDYSYSERNSPTKLWHDFFVFPVSVYYLLINAPALLYPVDDLTLLTFILFGAWVYLCVTDKRRTCPEAHIEFDWVLREPVKPIPHP